MKYVIGGLGEKIIKHERLGKSQLGGSVSCLLLGIVVHVVIRYDRSFANMRSQGSLEDSHLNAHGMVPYLLYSLYNPLQPLRHHQNRIFL